MRILRYTAFFSILPAVFFLTGCSKDFKNTMSSVQSTIAQTKGSEITPEYIKSVPYASSIVTVNDENPIFVALAFADKTNNDTYQLTWISRDKGTIVTENGRIIHTTGLDTDNLETLLAEDSQLPLPSKSNSWQAIYDWSPGYRYNFSANVESHSLGMETISNDLWTLQAEHVQEKIRLTNSNNQFINNFWVVPETDNIKAFVVKSIQYLGPKMVRIEMLMVKPFLEQKQNTTN